MSDTEELLDIFLGEFKMISPKWQTMWTESQHCSKSMASLPLASQQSKRILEDLKKSCCSPNKAVQMEALKCWGLWIQNQNPDVWEMNTVCFTAIRPLIMKKLQPFYKDVEICKLRLSLMWALLMKVQDIMHLEGPQYILEVFLQSCLTWLSSAIGDDSEKDISFLIFQLLLSVFNKNEALTGCDKEVFPPLSADILSIKKIFHQLADKFLTIFIHWRKVENKSVILKIWRHFLENCEESYEHIPVPVWHKVFKLAEDICSEKDEPVKERLAFLHSCATTLKSALSSSKFIDFGNLLTTPCEVLLKKLVELCMIECNEIRDSEMFLHSKEICQVLSDKSVSISGYDLCISLLDVLEEFCLRSLFWGVWCGLVYCYKVLLKGTHPTQFTKIETKFYRKLRGVVVNFELDRKDLHEDCVKEVEKHIGFLNISCLCSFRSVESGEAEVLIKNEQAAESAELKEKHFPAPLCITNGASNVIVPLKPRYPLGQFSLVPLRRRNILAPKKVVSVHIDLIKDIFSTLSINSTKSLLSSMFTFRFISTQTAQRVEMTPRTVSLLSNMGVSSSNYSKKKTTLALTYREEEVPSIEPPFISARENAVVLSEVHHRPRIGEVNSMLTRSKKKVEEERNTESEIHKRRKRKSFEAIVQEIVRKNKERKTEKNNKQSQEKVKREGKKKSRRGRPKLERPTVKDNESKSNACEKGKKASEGSVRKLKNSKKDEQPKNQKQKEKKSLKKEEKLENYFKVITKKSGDDEEKQVKKPKPRKSKSRMSDESTCCKSKKEGGQRKGEVGWKQTSLKSLMNPKSKAEKVRQGSRTRDKTADVTEEKPKPRKEGGRKVSGRPPAQLSPFKEVFHDHEYALNPPKKIKTSQKVAVSEKKKKKEKKENPTERKIKNRRGKADSKKASKLEPAVTEKIDCSAAKAVRKKKTSKSDKPGCRGEDESSNAEAPLLETIQIPTDSKVLNLEIPKMLSDNEPDLPKMDANEAMAGSQVNPGDLPVNEKIITLEIIKENLQVPNGRVCFDENSEKVFVNELRVNKKDRKRLRTLGSPIPNKKMRFEEQEEEADEKLPLEVAEKENLEEKQSELVSPTKIEKNGSLIPKQTESAKMMSSSMSRALRIIGLVPESTKARSWDASPKMEALKCLKAPNVDRNSRASKMLALLSENIVESEEVVTDNEEEVNSKEVLDTTPLSKTPLSSLKSPKSVKKRRSIRFDDAKNETVLYQTDTPPSQILEAKEKCRGMRPFEIAVHSP